MAGAFHQMLAENYGPVVKLQTVFRKNVFYTFDPKAMNHILLKEMSSFPPIRLESGNVVLGNGLLGTAGEEHRKQRKMLNPVFSIAHMRSMMPMFNDIAQKLENTLNKRVQNGPAEIDLLGWMARTALELIGQSGFGYSFDNMEDDVPKHKYSLVIKNLVQVPALGRLSLYNVNFLPLLCKLFSAKTRTLLMNAVPWKAVHEVRDMVTYMHEFSVKVYEEKRRALEEGDEAVMRQLGQGKDILSILMKDNVNAGAEDKLEEDEIIAQFCAALGFLWTWISIRTFIFAAMDTTSNAMSRILQLLTVHPDVQDKMRQEISQARRRAETMRLYPPVAHVFRRAMEDSVVPLSKPVRGVDGRDITEVILPKGTMVDISIINSNRNTDFWGPMRWSGNPKDGFLPFRILYTNAKIPGVYSHLMTFNGGGRSCIGFKFSQLEMKVIISMLVEKFKFSPAPGKDIFWQMSGISSPVVVGGDGHPKLPLLVESAKLAAAAVSPNAEWTSNIGLAHDDSHLDAQIPLTKPQTPPPPLEIQPLIVSGSSKNRVDLVFFSDGYLLEDKDKFMQDALRLAEDVSGNQTFHTVKPLMNFWAAFTASEESGVGTGGKPKKTPYGLYRDGTELRAVYYAHPEVADAACTSLGKQCDFPILLGNDPLYGGLGGRFTVITSSILNGPQILRHELGHSIIPVGEEYDGGFAYFGVNAYHDLHEPVPWAHWIDQKDDEGEMDDIVVNLSNMN
ncbi:cytochrome P450 [Gymnopus androsaceus JB14]|uniref:Cytochrome P450 n=1 Tax=Gymnopus androsaceus JB14 TaxID=1447944 RepID=A0A6A4HE06_9AGAR|nr:cytochrome P450 [Gymnopus androsaceus JB14]